MASRKIVIEFLGKDKNLGSTTADLDGKTGKLGATLAKVGKVAALGLAAGVAVGAKVMWDAGKAAAADEKSQAMLAQQMKNTAGASDAQVAATERWISKQGVAKGVADDELRPALAKLVTATKDVGKAQDLASLAMDVSAGSGKSLESVATALMKAQNGQISGLSRLGIQTKNAAGETMTFEQVTKSMADTFEGQAAAKANTLEGKIGRLKLIFDETKETIGAKLIPVVTRLADWFLNEGLPAVSKFGDWWNTKLVPVFKQVGEVIGQVLAGMRGDTAGNLGKIREIVSNVTSIVKSLWARFGDDILAHAKIVWQTVRGVVKGALDIISGVVKVFAGVLKGDWDGAWDGVKQIVRGAWQVIRSVVDGGLDLIKALMRTAWGVVKDIVRGAWDGIRDIVGAGADRLMDGLRGIPDRIRGLGDNFRAAGRFIIDAMVDGLKNAAGVISGIAGNVWSAVRIMLNSAISRINSALEFTIKLPGKNITINPPDIPQLATGGIVRARPGGVLALLGEGGHDEAVVPLSGPYAPRSGGGGGDRMMSGWRDAEAFARAIAAEVRREFERRDGQTVIKLQLDSRDIQTGLLRFKRTIGGDLGLA